MIVCRYQEPQTLLVVIIQLSSQLKENPLTMMIIRLQNSKLNLKPDLKIYQQSSKTKKIPTSALANMTHRPPTRRSKALQPAGVFLSPWGTILKRHQVKTQDQQTIINNMRVSQEKWWKEFCSKKMCSKTKIEDNRIIIGSCRKCLQRQRMNTLTRRKDMSWERNTWSPKFNQELIKI